MNQRGRSGLVPLPFTFLAVSVLLASSWLIVSAENERFRGPIDIHQLKSLSSMIKAADSVLVELYDSNEASRNMEYNFILVGAAIHRETDRIRVVRVNATALPKASKLCHLDGEELPAFRLFTNNDIKHPLKFHGNPHPLELVNWVNAELGTSIRLSYVRSLTDDNFDKVVHNPKKNVLVEFYMPWCGHCKRMAAEYEGVAYTFSHDASVVVAKVDCGYAPYACKENEINGFPTLKFFKAGSSKKSGDPYVGDRDGVSLVRFLNKAVGLEREFGGGVGSKYGRLRQLDSITAEFSAPGLSKDKAASLLDKLQRAISSLSEDPTSSAPIYEEVMTKAVAEGSSFISQEHARVYQQLTSVSVFDESTYLPLKTRLNVLEAFSVDAEDIWHGSLVQTLTVADFDFVVSGAKHVLVEFFAPWCGHCKAMEPEYEKLAKMLRGVDDIVIAKVDATEHRVLSQRYDIQGFPTLKLFLKNSEAPLDYQGARTAPDMARFIREKTQLKMRDDL